MMRAIAGYIRAQADARHTLTRSRAMAQTRRSGFAGIVLFVMAFGAAAAYAETYPNRPVRLIVPFAAGGLNDVAARLIAPNLARSLGQPFIVDNRPAASGIVGTTPLQRQCRTATRC